MQRPNKNIITLLSCLLTLTQCKDRYTSPYVSPKIGYLVVEGFITGNGPTKFNLSRTVPLSRQSSPVYENNAVVQVEGEDNSTFVLRSNGKGSYGGETLPFNPAVRYRVRIHTAANKDYLSDYAQYKPSPLIDSINWAPVNDNLEIYANTHDASATTRYYQWEFEETWEYHSAEVSLYKWVAPPGVIQKRNPEDQIYTCWGDRLSTAILLGTTAKLSDDVVYRQLIDKLPGSSLELSYKYSILVWQYALTEDAYNYMSLMQKNSESLGSVFDAQPVQLKGNIHSLTDPGEQVIGFVSAGTMQQQRIYIDHTQLPGNWSYSVRCPLNDHIVTIIPDSLPYYFGNGYTPINQEVNGQGILVGYVGNYTSCIDCRANGGVTTKPDFWPN